ncbi:MAG: glycosyltransferase involved in cell wall biosynthesis [Pseudohongiellaceae bacterium]|jgi:glycosyltransferase involved in cell wall biosynthesis
MTKKKVLIVYHYFATYRKPILEELNQSNEYEYYYAYGEKTNIDINIIRNWDFLGDENIIKNKVFKLDNKWFMKNVLFQIGLLKLIRTIEFDSVVFLGDPHFISTWISILYLKLKLKRTTVLLWTHGTLKDGKYKNIIKKYFYRLADTILLYGNLAKKKLIANGIDEVRLKVIYNSLDYKSQVKYRASLKNETFEQSIYFENPNLPLLCFVGRLTAQKKLSSILDAMYELSKKGIETNFIFIGNGEAKNDLENKAIKLHLNNNVFFYGECFDERELSKLIYFSDLCVSPGEVGLTAMHVMSYGTPVVTHNSELHQMPEYEAIVDDKTGLLYEYEQLPDLTNKIEQWLRKNTSREEIRDNCFHIIDNCYNPSVQKELIEEALKERADA